MPEHVVAASIASWVDALRARFAAEAPDLLPLFDIYAAEAAFGRNYVAPDLQRLPPGARVLEVGAGAMILSCQLVREGFAVTALEPTGTGFGHFERMRALILDEGRRRQCLPEVLDSTAEALAIREHFDFAFSVNVMEHVGDVEQALQRVAASLRPGASYRFTCANYLFPYEPHFNIPTLFSKRLTERLLRGKIHGRAGIPDPQGLWDSLNWINVAGLRRMARRMPQWRMSFDRSVLPAALERVGSDAQFAMRRSPLVRHAIRWLVRSRLHRVLGWAPAVMQPIIDCRLQRLAAAPAQDAR